MQARLQRSFERIPAEDVPRIFRLHLAEIDTNPDQPRRHIDEAALQELAASIERHGLIQPITVARTDSGRYMLVAGERRYRAHSLLGREEILAVVTSGNVDEISLIENIQRQDLHPVEEAAAYARMMQKHGWTQEQLAQMVGKARPTITNMLKLNELPEAIRAEAAHHPDIGRSLLFEIARAADPDRQQALWAAAKEGGTVRTMRARQAKPPSPTPTVDPLNEALDAGRRFARRLSRIEPGSPADGSTVEELRRLHEELGTLITRLAPAQNV